MVLLDHIDKPIRYVCPLHIFCCGQVEAVPINPNSNIHERACVYLQFYALHLISSGHLFRMPEMLQLCFHLDICLGCPKCYNFLNSTNGKGFFHSSDEILALDHVEAPWLHIFFTISPNFFSNKLNQQFFLYFLIVW